MSRPRLRATSINLPTLHLRADIRPDTIDPEARTADLTFSTGAPVPRLDWTSGERYIETLGLKKAQVRLDRLNSGAPFLNAHSAFGVEDVLGVVVSGSAKVVDGAAVATVRFSKRADVEPIWQDVRDGILRNVSVGYRVHRYEQTEGVAGAPPQRHATDWEPYELSAVPMGADPGAHVRADKAATHPCVLIRGAKETTAMEPTAIAAPADDQPTQPDEQPSDAQRAQTIERERVQGILIGCRNARLPQAFADKLITDGVELSEARGQILARLNVTTEPEKGPKPGANGVRITGADPLENVWRGITGSLLHRINPGGFPLDDNAKQYRTHSLMRAAEECLEQRGVRTRGMSKWAIAAAALGLTERGALHSSSDFANILADVANKSLRRAYEEAPATWQPFTRIVSAPDFKALKRNQLGEAPELKKVLEHGEITRGTIAEGKESFALSTYARIFGITRVALINDDLEAFGRVTMAFGRSARQKEADLVYAVLLRNAAMADAVALFHSTHANYTSSGTAISIDSLGVGRALMGKQRGLDGLTNLNLVPRFLLVSPSKQTIAEQYTSVIQPALGSSVNPFAGKLQVIAEARLENGMTLDGESLSGSALSWYLAATPDQIDVIELAYLEGENGPSIETRSGWDVDGMETKCRHDAAAAVIDYRGLYKNAGA